MSSLSTYSHAGAQWEEDKFKNQEANYSTNFSNLVEIMKAFVTTKRAAPTPDSSLPIRAIDKAELNDIDQPVLYRIGHSTVLMRIEGEYLLTDPVFSERASPVQWAGPRRFHQLPISLDQLPDIKAVIISHDHYDHLDKAAIIALAGQVEYFVTPLMVGNHLRQWGIDDDKIIELDWWQSTKFGSLELVATPSQHFSGRGLLDRDKTLWASWAILGHQARVFFSGDSGYFSGFKEIGERYGPFDLTLMEAGAYNTLWSEIHMLPEQSLQAHLDVKGRAMLPIHNSTFDLALHDWHEPLETLHQLAQQKGVQLITPRFGDQVSLVKPEASFAWWRGSEPAIEMSLATE